MAYTFRYIEVEGPQEDFDGVDTFTVYTVCVMADGEPTGKIYRCRSFDRAMGLARKMAADRRMEISVEVDPVGIG